MHYFDFHIGDYHKKTDHLTDDEDLAYRRLLDLYYDTEKPIPNETQSVSRRLRMASKQSSVEVVLCEFFVLCDDNCWHNKTCDEIIEEYHKRCKTNKDNGLKGGRPKKEPKNNPVGSHSEPSRNPNHKPRTNNQEPVTSNIYKFEGKVIRLNVDDYSRWEKAYPHVKLNPVLQSRDDYLHTTRPNDKNWFMSTSNYLAKLEKEELSKIKPKSKHMVM